MFSHFGRLFNLHNARGLQMKFSSVMDFFLIMRVVCPKVIGSIWVWVLSFVGVLEETQ
jgi:hypothetical protein